MEHPASERGDRHEVVRPKPVDKPRNTADEIRYTPQIIPNARRFERY